MLFEPDSFSALAALEVLYTCPRNRPLRRLIILQSLDILVTDAGSL